MCGIGNPTGGGVLPILAQAVTLGVAPDSSSAAMLTFGISTISVAGGTYACAVSVANALGIVIATSTVDFTANATTTISGEQGGSIAPGGEWQ